MTQLLSRRSALAALGALTGVSLAETATSAPALRAPGQVARKRAIRIANLTDTHIENNPKSEAALVRCLHQVNGMNDKPALMLHGGDVIMDALGRQESAVKTQWDIWNRLIKAENSIPVEYCIGNHDVWGYGGAKQDPRYGKAWVVEQMGLGKPYRRFDRGGWRFIVLDSTQPNADGSWYTANLDPAQRQWLEAELAATPATMPVLLISHIPILTATAFYSKSTVKNGNWEIPGSWVHTDAVELIPLFNRYPNVKVALSGHMHLLDHVTYNGMQHFCNGAVSGNWWSSERYHETPAGYAILDLYDDGTVERTYQTYQFS